MYKLISFRGVALPTCMTPDQQGIPTGEVVPAGVETLDGSIYIPEQDGRQTPNAPEFEIVRSLFPARTNSRGLRGEELREYQAKFLELTALVGRTGALIREVPDGSQRHIVTALLQSVSIPRQYGTGRQGSEITMKFKLSVPVWRGTLHIVTNKQPEVTTIRTESNDRAEAGDAPIPGGVVEVATKGSENRFVNNGNVEQRAVEVTVSPNGAGGSIFGLWIYNDTTGHAIEWLNNGRLIDEGEELRINTKSRAVGIYDSSAGALLQGAYRQVTNMRQRDDWFELAPGVNNFHVDFMTINTTTPHVIYKVRYTDAWQ